MFPFLNGNKHANSHECMYINIIYTHKLRISMHINHTCVYIYIYTHMYIYTHIYIYIHEYIYMRVYNISIYYKGCQFNPR